MVDSKELSVDERRARLRAELWRNALPTWPNWAMVIELIGQLGPDSRIGKAILKAWSE